MRIRGVFLGLEKTSSKSETISIPLPGRVTIPMAQCAGEECVPVVRKHDKVKVGQKIGEGKNGETPVHSSVSGKVADVIDIDLPSGVSCKAVVIDTDGMQLTENVKPPYISSTEDFISAVRESGCVGLSGSGDDISKKLEAARGADTLIINGVECDPLITADHRCMLEDTDDLVKGVEALMKYMDIKKTMIAVSEKNSGAIGVLGKAFAENADVTVETVLNSYPQGAEKVLVFNLCEKVIKGDRTAADMGVLVLNVSTAAFIGYYLRTGMPLTYKRVTVSGDLVRDPCNLKVPVGTHYSELFKFADTNMEAADKIVCGGLMMGQAAESTDLPICKADNCLLAFIRPEEDAKGKLVESKIRTECLRCTRCVSACTMGLMPLKIEKAYDKKDLRALKRLHAELCMECGACSFICPARRPLAEKTRLAKQRLVRKEGR